MEVFVVIFLALFAKFILNRFFDRLAVRFAATTNRWDDTLLEAARRPATMLVWAIGLFWALEIVQQETDSALFEIVDPGRRVVVIALISWFLVRLIRGAERVLVDPARFEKPMDHTTARAIGKLLRASTIITGALVMLQTLGFSISGVLAFGGIGGIAVGFAAKDLLANFFGALVVYLDRPFAVGDWIRSPDKNIEGTVEDIGWRVTRIRTFDQRPLYVPNATFTSISVENPSRMLNRRIYETIGIRYADADRMRDIVRSVTDMLRAHPELETEERTLIVHFNSYGPSSLDFFVYTFTKTTQWVKFHEIKEDVLLKIYEIIRDHGADIAFPTTTVHFGDPLRLDRDREEAPEPSAP
ncbi:MAG: mechanosensitive ion channel family protein [Rhodocyclaceae bacterium]|nr:mechanosensitive ion channel family protein [Rhodocyclaceae bacterium]